MTSITADSLSEELTMGYANGSVGVWNTQTWQERDLVRCNGSHRGPVSFIKYGHLSRTGRTFLMVNERESLPTLCNTRCLMGLVVTVCQKGGGGREV